MTFAGKFVELKKNAHDREGFDCGNQELNDFLRTKAAKHRKLKISRTMVLPAAVSAQSLLCAIQSYYTTSLLTIERKALPGGNRLPQYPVPVFLIGRLAVAKELKGLGLGKITLIKALESLYNTIPDIQTVAIVVDPIDADADAFYRHFNFQPLLDSRDRLFLPMGDVEKLFR